MDKDWEKIEKSPTWDYQTGGQNSTIQGVLTSIEKEVGPNLSTLYNIQSEDGSVKAVWGSIVLDARMKNLIIGEEVKIQYLGKVAGTKGKKDYHSFQVFHRVVPTTEE